MVNSSNLISCPTPAVGPEARRARVKVHFLMDSLHFDFGTVGSEAFRYEANPRLYPLNRNNPGKAYHHKPGSIISVEVGLTRVLGNDPRASSTVSTGFRTALKRINDTAPFLQGENLDLAIYKHEVEARIGEGVCTVKTLTHNHLYCEPPAQQPSAWSGNKQDGMDSLPEFTVS